MAVAADLAMAVEQAMERDSMSLRQAAARCGVSFDSMARVLEGRGRLSLRNVEKIVDALGLDLKLLG